MCSVLVCKAGGGAAWDSSFGEYTSSTFSGLCLLQIVSLCSRVVGAARLLGNMLGLFTAKLGEELDVSV